MQPLTPSKRPSTRNPQTLATRNPKCIKQHLVPNSETSRNRSEGTSQNTMQGMRVSGTWLQVCSEHETAISIALAFGLKSAR